MKSWSSYEVWLRGVEIWSPPLRTAVNDKFASRKHIVNKCKMFSGMQILELGALPPLLQFDHKSSSSDDLTLQQMEKREKVYRKRVCKFSTGLACEQGLHLGDIVKSRRARGTWEGTRKRKCCSLARSRVAGFARLNRRARSQVSTGLYFVMQLKGLCHGYQVHFGIPKSVLVLNYVIM